MPKSKLQAPKILVIVGETASGKSALAMSLAQQFDGELICADSSTVRTGLDIGSAKPSLEDQKTVKHHLLDVAAPDDSFSAAKFKELANEAITDIAKRGKLPIMVGGSGLYVDSVLYDYEFLPASDPKERELLSKLSIKDLLSVARGRKLDVSDIDTANKVRLVRFIQTNGKVPERKPLRENTLILGLQPDRQQLGEQIQARVEQMIENGLEQEVEQLASKYGWQSEGLKAVGYREWRDYFLDKKSLDRTRAEIIKDTKNLSKKQRTWFKRNKSIQWIATPVNQQEAVDLVTTFINE